MDDYRFNELEPEELRRSQTERSCQKTAVYLGISLILIAGMIWSGISGAVWLFKQTQSSETTSDNEPGEDAATTQPAATPALPATPDPDHRINRITFINANGQIETIAPDGTDRRQISDQSFSFLFPAWSPTGEYIAAIGGQAVYRFTDSAQSAEPTVQKLYASQGQNPFYLYWSPNGRFLTLLANHPNGMGLHIVPADGSAEARLLELGSPFYWDWAADSDEILIHTGFAGEEAQLALLSVKSGYSGRSITMPGSFQAPDISRDGRYWAYAELDGNGLSWLVAADIETGAQQRQRHAGQTALGWSPTANQLAFTSGGEGRLDFAGPLRLLDAATGETRLLSKETVWAFFWSPNGRYLAVITSDNKSGGVIAEENDIFDSLNTNHPHLGKPARQHPTITLNLLLVDVVSGEKRHLLEFEPTVTFITQFLPFFDQYALSHRLWSPASNALVLPTQAGGNNQITIIPINGSSPQQLAVGDMPFWSHQ